MLITPLLGLVVGLILALTGAGGGVLAVPLLVFGTGIGMAQAAPIGLVAVGMGAAVGALLGLKAGVVRYRAALVIAASGAALAPLGLWIAHRIDNRWLVMMFACVLIHVAWKTYRRTPSPSIDIARCAPCMLDPAVGRFVWTTRCARALALSGAAAGLLSGLIGVGGGFVIVPALRRYTNLPMNAVVATSLAVIALVSFNTVAISVMNGSLQWPVALPFWAGAVAGMLCGRVLALSLNEQYIQQAFASVALIVGISMILRVGI